MFFRRAVDPQFDADKIVPAAMALVAKLLNPTEEAESATAPDTAKAEEPRR
jgi:hypothetical protein